MITCSKCSRRAVIFQRHAIRHLCTRHFIEGC